MNVLISILSWLGLALALACTGVALLGVRSLWRTDQYQETSTDLEIGTILTGVVAAVLWFALAGYRP